MKKDVGVKGTTRPYPSTHIYHLNYLFFKFLDLNPEVKDCVSPLSYQHVAWFITHSKGLFSVSLDSTQSLYFSFEGSLAMLMLHNNLHVFLDSIFNKKGVNS